MGQFVLSFLRCENGATAIEYGLIAALVAVGAIAAMTALGGGVSNLFGSTEEGASKVLTDASAKMSGPSS